MAISFFKHQYNPDNSLDVKDFIAAVSFANASGPIGINQAERKVKELARTIEGRSLLAKAHLATKRSMPDKKSFHKAVQKDYKPVKARTGMPAEFAIRRMAAMAFTNGAVIAFGTSSPGSKMLAHELAHVLQHLEDNR